MSGVIVGAHGAPHTGHKPLHCGGQWAGAGGTLDGLHSDILYLLLGLRELLLESSNVRSLVRERPPWLPCWYLPSLNDNARAQKVAQSTGCKPTARLRLDPLGRHPSPLHDAGRALARAMHA
jgi:hypothetical protein